MLTTEAMHAKYAHRFLRLVSLFLTSTYLFFLLCILQGPKASQPGDRHLPSYILHAFTKKVARLALFAKAPTTLLMLHMLYALLHRYPDVLMPLLHRPAKRIPAACRPKRGVFVRPAQEEKARPHFGEEELSLDMDQNVPEEESDTEEVEEAEEEDALLDKEEEEEVIDSSEMPMPSLNTTEEALSHDPFDAVTLDLTATHAEESSLWELEAFRHHALTTISTFARRFAERFRPLPFDMAHLYDMSYATVTSFCSSSQSAKLKSKQVKEKASKKPFDATSVPLVAKEDFATALKTMV